MAQLDLFFKHLLEFEGGFVNNPADPGGATNKGITLATFQIHAQPLLGIPPNLANLKALTDEQAFKIYKAAYWDVLHGDEIPDQPLAEILFDFYVNAGGNAVRLLQKLLNEKPTGAMLNADGLFGAATLKALLAAEPVDLYRRYKAGRRAYYQDLAARRPALAQFLKGWLRRTDSFADR
ncbi:glycoside hydrolase family 108 protein [Amantichitinum ursilacus]|uniref:Putative Peptidoglycan domain protein n=1 Tax=Amantichitinum ursilacus TaxID=857265 RepID=A0A0N0XID4_9NEIS|nr:N-acetylmuramidase [Amantichitinum ursilacus]KPC52581.1 putative Peptidoglycan domain protein [Amantichitinum ursilacus]